MSLFDCYDGLGPVRRFEITRRAIGPQLAAIERDALAATGLYVLNTAPEHDPQVDAFKLAPAVDWSVESAVLFEEVSYG